MWRWSQFAASRKILAGGNYDVQGANRLRRLIRNAFPPVKFPFRLEATLVVNRLVFWSRVQLDAFNVVVAENPDFYAADHRNSKNVLLHWYMPIALYKVF